MRRARLWANAKIDDCWLECPGCGEGAGALHHEVTRSYDRHEDEKEGRITTIEHPTGDLEQKIGDVDSRATKNPSSRRHGLVIDFYCEECDGIYNLFISQHKGATLVAWLVDKEGALRFDREGGRWNRSREEAALTGKPK